MKFNKIEFDSRKVQTGDLFIAIPGYTTDGRIYIDDAIEKGASMVLAEAPYLHQNHHDTTVLAIPDLSNKLGVIASSFYHDPSYGMQIMGVTGTNGKSSCCHYIAEILRKLSVASATIGTLGINKGNGYQNLELTTPEPITLQQQLVSLKQQEILHVAMEVSSHALQQERVAGIKFHTAIFTNLTQDHLDYHNDMTEYWQAKLKLFTKFNIQNAIINLDDPYGRELLEFISEDCNIIGYSLGSKEEPCLNLLLADQLQNVTKGLQVRLKYNSNNYTVVMPVLGKFNVSNMLAAIATVLGLGYDLTDILEIIPTISNIPGRMQVVEHSGFPLAIIDFAHTPDALANVLKALSERKTGKLWCVFGCGGDRDRSKRPAMLTAALQYSDHIVITQDNPRTEDPEQIVEDILADVENNKYKNIIIEHDRKAAIELALSKAKSDLDIVLIAGKGHEKYQIIGKQKFEFSDFAVVENFIKKRKD